MDFSAAVAYPPKDQDWIKKTLIGGVLTMIPIANFIPVGHMLAIAKSVSEGGDRLPDWQSLGGYFRKGFGVAVISIVVMLPAILVIVCGYGLLLGVLAASGGGSSMEDAINLAMIGVQCIAIVLSLACALFIAPALSEYVITGHVREAIKPAAVLAEFRARAGQYVILFVVSIVGSWLAAMIGVIACGIGILFTMPFVNFVYGHLLGQLVAARRVQ